LGRHEGFDARCAWEIARSIQEHGVDLVQAHQYTPFFYGSLGRILARRRCGVLFTEHGRHQPDFRRPKRVVANRFLLRRHDRVVAVGSAVRDALNENEGIPAGRIEVIYNGIPLERFEAALAHRDRTRAELGIRHDDTAIILVARLDYLKDHATALRAMKRVVTKRPDARLFLVGEGPERQAIEAQVSALGLAGSVHLLGQRNDAPALVAAADVALLTSTSEGIPLTLIEAMAAGRPVVATDVGGVSEVVIDGETGYLSPARDDGALAARILDLASSPDLRRERGRAGLERARALFSEARMHAGYVRLYDGLTGFGGHAAVSFAHERLSSSRSAASGARSVQSPASLRASLKR
jgi:glycosyltransferase involved in cell wall biosynthesis